VSVKVGSVRMAERYLKSDPPTPAEADAMIAGIDEALAEAPSLPAGAPLVATAGTATTIAAVALGMAVYEADRVQGMRVSHGEVERQLGRYLATTLADRRGIVGLDARRADVIAGGAAVLTRVMARMGADEMVVSDRGVRWGMAYEMGA
jgi:exopolyphosphatase/guanosine-5'-triphosphate,3'-diphosphate pyrophosphatase